MESGVSQEAQSKPRDTSIILLPTVHQPVCLPALEAFLQAVPLSPTSLFIWVPLLPCALHRSWLIPSRGMVLFLELFIGSPLNAQICASPLKDYGKTSGTIIMPMFITRRTPLCLYEQRNSFSALPRLSHGTMFPGIASW